MTITFGLVMEPVVKLEERTFRSRTTSTISRATQSSQEKLAWMIPKSIFFCFLLIFTTFITIRYITSSSYIYLSHGEQISGTTNIHGLVSTLSSRRDIHFALTTLSYYHESNNYNDRRTLQLSNSEKDRNKIGNNINSRQSEICSCSPTVMNIRISLLVLNPCDVDTLNDKNGIKGTLCLIGEAGDPGFDSGSGGGPSNGDHGGKTTSSPSPSILQDNITRAPSVNPTIPIDSTGDMPTFSPTLSPTGVSSSISTADGSATPSAATTTTSTTTSTSSSTTESTTDPFLPPKPTSPNTNTTIINTTTPTYSPTSPFPTYSTFSPTISTTDAGTGSITTIEIPNVDQGEEGPPIVEVNVTRIIDIHSDTREKSTYYPTPSYTYYPTVDRTYAPTVMTSSLKNAVGTSHLEKESDANSKQNEDGIVSLLERYYGMTTQKNLETSNHQGRMIKEVINMDDLESLEKDIENRSKVLINHDTVDPYFIPQLLGTWTSIPPSDEIFKHFPDLKEQQEDLYRQRNINIKYSAERRSETVRMMQDMSYDFTPTQLLSAQFIEIDTSPSMNIINQDDQYINLTYSNNADDIILSFTSISATLDPALPIEDQLDIVPGGVILILIGQDDTGEILRNRLMWTYTMECGMSVKTIEVGDEFGWTTFDGVEPAREEFCPASSATPMPSPQPSAVDREKPTKPPGSDFSMDYNRVLSHIKFDENIERISSLTGEKKKRKLMHRTSKLGRLLKDQDEVAVAGSIENDFGGNLSLMEEKEIVSLNKDLANMIESKPMLEFGRQIKRLRKSNS